MAIVKRLGSLKNFDLKERKFTSEKLEDKGEIIDPYDLLIASQAISNEMILVTKNEKEFKRIKELKLENWIN